jgi:hypothetical protein
MILVIGTIIYFLSKRKKYKSLLEMTGMSAGIPYKTIRKDRKIYLDSIETIIKNSEKLNQLINKSKKKEEIYAKLLQDQELINKLRKAKSSKEVEQILVRWLKDNNYISRKKFEKYIQEISASSEEEGNQKIEQKAEPHIKKEKRIVKPSQKAQKETQEKTETKPRVKRIKTKPLSTTQQKAQIPKTENIPTPSKKQNPKSDKKENYPNISEKTVEYYEQIVYLLESGKIDQILDVLKKLNNAQLQEIISHYQTNLQDKEQNKFDKFLSKSKTPNDITHLLHLEAVKSLEDENERIRELLSQARRKGVDIKGEELDLFSIPHKIKMFKATFDKKDFYKVRDSLLKIEKEIIIKMKEKGLSTT